MVPSYPVSSLILSRCSALSETLVSSYSLFANMWHVPSSTLDKFACPELLDKLTRTSATSIGQMFFGLRFMMFNMLSK